MFACLESVAVLGVEPVGVLVEARIMPGLRRFALVGFADSVVREAKDRVRCAIESSGFDFPPSDVVVSLSPAALPKSGSGFDLPIALSILAAQGVVSAAAVGTFVALGELTLCGEVRPTPGALQAALYVASQSSRKLLLPRESAQLASLVSGVTTYEVSSLADAVRFLNGVVVRQPHRNDATAPTPQANESEAAPVLSLGDVIGQSTAKRVLQIVAAGGHNLVMVGPPGSGKSMLASRLPSLLPPLTMDELVEVTKVHSALGTAFGRNQNSAQLAQSIRARPFRSPHHSVSTAGLIGGGSMPRPGELSLAHKGVLFLDELPEFRRDTLEALRQPLEERVVRIARANGSLTFPADIVLIAAMNPCPCGKYGTEGKVCVCSPLIRHKYQSRISGPFLDRIDLQVWVAPVPVSELQQVAVDCGQTANLVRGVTDARQFQHERFKSEHGLNSRMSSKQQRKFCAVDTETKSWLERSSDKYALSARAYNRVLKVSRTIADLEGSSEIRQQHVSEALSYRLSVLGGP